jgi:cyclophilin family peptidyl-prolyl cis-trans isomerase
MKAYITLSHGDAPLGTLRLTLRPDVVPRTVENFVHFLTATAATANATTTTTTPTTSGAGGYGYRDSTFHRIIPKFMAQGGDFVNRDGTGSATMFDGRPSFPDENFILSHSQRGTLSMANSGPDTNGCQFFVTFGAAAHLDGKHVVFGYVDWREDGESAGVLDALEGVRIDRRNGDRPLEEVRIEDCGILGERERKGAGKAGGEGGGGIQLVGEAKKNKLMQAYGDVDPAAAVDEDEINLDDEDDEVNRRSEEEDPYDNAPSKTADDNSNKGDFDEIDIEGEIGEPAADDDDVDREDASGSTAADGNSGKLSKKAALQKRLAALRAKINQSRTLNRREVHAEATRIGTDDAAAQERKRQNKQDRSARQEEYDAYVVGKLRDGAAADDGDPKASGGTSGGGGKAGQKKSASLFQPAYDSIRQMNARAEKEERSRHGPDDYYNPEGQYSNYERNLTSVRRATSSRRGGDAAPGPLDSYDPTLTGHADGNDASGRQSSISEKEGAKRLAMEMKRRTEKKANQKRKLEFDAVDVTSINDRNKRFNQKIGRNFDKHTAEIRQNLERGTAL